MSAAVRSWLRYPSHRLAASPGAPLALICGLDSGVEPHSVTPRPLGAQRRAAAQCELEPAQAMPHRISWARLLKRVFDIDMHTCPNCGGGELKIIAAILWGEPGHKRS